MLASVAAISCGGDHPKSLVFAVQPNVLSTDMTATLTIFFTPPSKDAKPPTEVKVRIAGAKDEIALTGVKVVDGHPNQVQATVTAGKLSAGTYDLVLGDGGTLDAGLVEVDQPDINIVQVNPPFGSPSADTSISVTT